jgi:hypothetical protein
LNHPRVNTCLNYFASIQELLWITMNYCELLELQWITRNYLDFYYIFLLGYRLFNWAIILFCWVIIFLLGQLGITTGFCWGYVFWQLIRSELHWITVNCCALQWITLYWCKLLWIDENTLNYCEINLNCWNYFELHWITALLTSSWRKY